MPKNFKIATFVLGADGHRLLLDLYLPTDVNNAPLIVWVHGGAWRRGSRSNMPLIDLVKSGFTMASVDYRLSPVGKFPAQVHDCKAPIRFLRGSAAKFGTDAERIGVAGSSAGGHLAALIGVTSNHKALAGNIGDYDDQSSAVHAIVDYYGPTNFMTILKQSAPHGLSVRVPALELLLGGGPEKETELARLASPIFHVDRTDPPLLSIHGDQDPQVPINQSHELHGEASSGTDRQTWWRNQKRAVSLFLLFLFSSIFELRDVVRAMLVLSAFDGPKRS